jgi:PleD family two-component response regulator
VEVSESLNISSENARPGVVLVTTDMEWSARWLETVLNPYGYVVVRAASDQHLVSLAATMRPDAVILEHRLPSLNALGAMQALREHPRFVPGTPLLVLSSSPLERAQRLALYNAGAWDHYTQPIDSEVLVRQLRTLIEVKRQVERLQEATLVDSATGLYSSHGLAQRAREIGAGAFRRRESLACVAVALDLDPAPEEELAATAAAAAARQLSIEWMRHGRSTDALGHLGPTEFGIIAAGTGAGGAGILLGRLRERVEAIPVVVEGSTCRVRVRAELAAVEEYSAAPSDAVELLRHASHALHGGASLESALPGDTVLGDRREASPLS